MARGEHDESIGRLSASAGPGEDDPGSAPRREASLAPSRREFLGIAGAGAALLLTGCDALPALTPVPRLSAANSRRITDGIQHFRTRPDLLPPSIVIDHPRQGPLGGYVVTEAHRGRSQPGPLIFDQNGRMMWFHPVAPHPSVEHRAFNVDVQSYQGKRVLTWFEGALVGNHGQGHYEIVDHHYRQVAQVHGVGGYKGDLHEFVLTPEGTALFTCYGRSTGSVDMGGTVRTLPYTYGVVQEVDVATGELLFQWRSDEHVPLSESYKPFPKNPGGVWDYFHINSIAIDPTDQNLVVSSRTTAACYKVNRKTGKVMWRLGGRHSDFEIGPGAHFFYQHDVRIHPGGVMTMFDNEGGPPQHAQHSRALVLGIDERRRKVWLKDAYLHHPEIYSPALGSVQPVEKGRVFVGWGTTSYFTEYASGGRVMFDGHLGAGVHSYRAFRDEWVGRPQTRPDVSVVRSTGSAAVYVSWNGATELANWGVLGGPSASNLSAVGTAPVAGFETRITVPSAPPWLVLVAYDEHGRELSRSVPVSG